MSSNVQLFHDCMHNKLDAQHKLCSLAKCFVDCVVGCIPAGHIRRTGHPSPVATWLRQQLQLIIHLFKEGTIRYSLGYK